ncbi:MAG: substrate-binding domain-containing protein [Cyanobacteria bacterium P01_D01_bin.105]
MVNRKTASTIAVTALLACAVPAKSVAFLVPPVIAQAAPSFSAPNSIGQGTTVRISSGSDNMNAISAVLGKGFEEQYKGNVEIVTKSADEALKDVLNDNADVAAISRPLTAEEEAQGFVAIPVRREKIAVVVKTDNPFSQNITSSQFAQIFRGEITDWSELGGQAGPIRVIDRPDVSETRQALKPYPVFKTADFKTGSNATQLSEDSTAALAKELGIDGIGYALVGQLEDQPDLRALQLHKTLPTNPRYPFSQPYSFVYAKVPSNAASAFLGYATGNAGQSTLQNTQPTDTDNLTASPTTVNANNNEAASDRAAEKTTSAVTEAEATNTGEETGNDGIGQLNADGQRVDSEGNLISPEGFLIDPNGNLINADGNPLPEGSAGIPGVGINLSDIGDSEEDVANGANRAPEEETDGIGNAVNDTRNLSERGHWWWLLFPLAGLGLLIWAAGRRGSEEEAGYSANANGISDDRVRNAFSRSPSNKNMPTASTSNNLRKAATEGVDIAKSTTTLKPLESNSDRSSASNTETRTSKVEKADAATGAGDKSADSGAVSSDTESVSLDTGEHSSTLKDSEWLNRIKQRINEASSNLESTASEIKDDITKQD